MKEYKIFKMLDNLTDNSNSPEAEEAYNAIDNRELIEAMRNEIIDDSPANHEATLKALKTANFLAPVTVVEDKDVIYGQDIAKHNYFDVLRNDQSGKCYFAVYTDESEIKKMKKEGKVCLAITNFDTYVEEFANPENIPEICGVVINPMGMSLILEREAFGGAKANFAQSLNAAKNNNGSKGVTFKFMVPDRVPDEIINALCEYMRLRTEIDKAYLLMMAINDGKTGLLLVLDAKGDFQSMLQGLDKITKPYRNGMELAVFPYNSELGEKATSNDKCKPFYVRE